MELNMINILWVEDEFSKQKKIEWFEDRKICVKTNFLDAKKAINTSLEKFDLVVLDINLENTEHTSDIKDLAEHFKITEKEFLEESGMNLFLSLLEKGFPKEQIIFLTANADNNISLVDELRKVFTEKNREEFKRIFSEIQNGLGEEQINKCQELIYKDVAQMFEYLENYYKSLTQDETKNTYNRFCEAYKRCRIEPPEAINKNLNEAKHSLNTWLEKHEKNSYLVLRRGVIEGCNALKSHIEKDENNLQFRDFIKTEHHEILTTDIKNYLDTLSQFLPLREPKEQSLLNIQYRLFLRALAHEWEENIDAHSLKQKYAGDLKNIHDIHTFAWIMKMTRNWVSHANLLEPLNPQFIAFLFLINMRSMFKLSKAIQPYESILLHCICKNPVKPIDFKILNESILYSENKIDEICNFLRISEYKENKNGNEIKDKNNKRIPKIFADKLNSIYQKNTGNPDAEEHDFKPFLLQYFWINQKSYFIKLTIDSGEFLPTLARHIYSHSFLSGE